MKLADLFTDRMVLQYGRPVCIFGEGEGMGTVTLSAHSVSFEAKDGKFRAYLPAMEPGGPYELTVTMGEEKIILKDVMVGAVYLAAGQSNVEIHQSNCLPGGGPDCGNVRIFRIAHDVDLDGNPSYEPHEWQYCEGQMRQDFSAIGGQFGLQLERELHMPVGVIDCSKGASRVDAWTDPAITDTPDYQEMIRVHHSDLEYYHFNPENKLYRWALLPIVPYTVAGVLWYQGESNRNGVEATHYALMLEKMIRNWRNLWAAPELPFYCVQVMPFDDTYDKNDWAMLRSQTRQVTEETANTFLITCVISGEPHMIHPIHKEKVSEALCNAVLCNEFRRDVEYCGPMLEKIERTEKGAVLTFTHAKGLCVPGLGLQDTFAVKKDGEKVPAAGEVKDGKLVLTYPDADKAEYIEMGYKNVPNHNVYNFGAYLAAPFRAEIQ